MRHPFFDQDEPKLLTAAEAVRYGKLVINLPVSLLLIIGPIIGALAGNIVLAMVLFAVFFCLAWLWWSFSVPRWREWAKRSGADEDETQRLAEQGRGALVWPRGSIFEKTEFRRKKK